MCYKPRKLRRKYIQDSWRSSMSSSNAHDCSFYYKVCGSLTKVWRRGAFQYYLPLELVVMHAKSSTSPDVRLSTEERETLKHWIVKRRVPFGTNQQTVRLTFSIPLRWTPQLNFDYCHISTIKDFLLFIYTTSMLRLDILEICVINKPITTHILFQWSRYN